MNRLHPLAWWLWAAGLAVCAMRTTNPFVLSLIGAVACFVVVSCRGTAPWARSIGFFLRLGLVVIVIRVAIEIVFGRRGVPGHVLFTMPQVPLPHWAEGVSVGGAVTLESLLVALVDGLQIAVILLCFGAANSLASPYRLLRCLPAVLYETGVAVTVALAFTPELVLSIGLVRQARRLRGIPTAGLRGWRGIAVPVLESALDRSLQLATSMDARGYGRRRRPVRGRHGGGGPAHDPLALPAGPVATGGVDGGRIGPGGARRLVGRQRAGHAGADGLLLASGRARPARAPDCGDIGGAAARAGQPGPTPGCRPGRARIVTVPGGP